MHFNLQLTVSSLALLSFFWNLNWRPLGIDSSEENFQDFWADLRLIFTAFLRARHSHLCRSSYVCHGHYFYLVHQAALGQKDLTIVGGGHLCAHSINTVLILSVWWQYCDSGLYWACSKYYFSTSAEHPRWPFPLYPMYIRRSYWLLC